MNPWIEALPAFLAALLIFTLPGAAVLAALRVRGLMLLFLAPAVSVSVVAVSAITAPLIGLPWGLPVVLLGTAVAAAGAWAAGRFIPALRSAPAAPGGWSGIAAVTAGVLISLAMTTALLTMVAPTPEQFTQGYDSVFHLNATQYAMEQGNASSFAISGFILPPGKSSFYPGAWHGVASLLAVLTGASTPAATNLVWLAVAGVVWPLSAMFLARVLFGGRRLLLVCAGIFAAAFPAFPWLLLQYGSAYPNSLSNALVPVGIALVLMILRPAIHTGLEPAQALAVVALFLPGAVTAQPNGVFSILLVLTPLLLFLLFSWLRTGFASGRRGGWLRVALLLVVMASAGGALLALPQIRSLFNYASLAFMPFPLAVLRNATMAPAPIWFPAIALTALVLAGVLAGRRRPGLGWLPAAAILLVFMYPLTAGTDFGPTNIMLAPWWDNPERIAALLPLLGVPLAALGMVRCTDWLSRRLPSFARRKARPAAVAGLAVVLALGNPGLWQMKEQVGIMYNVPAAPDGLAQVDAQELALIHRLGEYTTPADVIANNPYNGSALAMALAGRTMLFPYSSQAELTPDQFTLRFWLNRVDSDPEVCAAAKRLGVTHLLDFGTDYIPAFAHPRSLYPGVTLAPDSAGFTLVASEGHARLYKLTTCDGTPPG